MIELHTKAWVIQPGKYGMVLGVMWFKGLGFILSDFAQLTIGVLE
jgi:hypothetical protein